MAIHVYAEFTGHGTLVTSFASHEDAERAGDSLRDRGWAAITGSLMPKGFYLHVPRMRPEEFKALSKSLGLEVIDRRWHRRSLRACG